MPLGRWIQLLDVVGEVTPPPTPEPATESTGFGMQPIRGLARVNVEIVHVPFVVVGFFVDLSIIVTDGDRKPLEGLVVRASVSIDGDVTVFMPDEVDDVGDGVYTIEVAFDRIGTAIVRWNVDGVYAEQRFPVVTRNERDRIVALLEN